MSVFVSVQKFDAAIEALEKGELVELAALPPSPEEGQDLWNQIIDSVWII